MLLIGCLVSALGWGISRFLFDKDRSDLRFEVQRVSQAVNTIDGVKLSLDGEYIYCEAARLTLLLSHNRGGKSPVLVNGIAVVTEPVPPSKAKEAPKCQVDSLASKPFGIVEQNTYILTLSSTGGSGRYIKSAGPGAAWAVSMKNILQSPAAKIGISLKPDEEPIAFEVILVSSVDSVQRVRFVASYDALGEKKIATGSLLIAR